MLIPVQCPSCKKYCQLHLDQSGQEVICPYCKCTFKVGQLAPQHPMNPKTRPGLYRDEHHKRKNPFSRVGRRKRSDKTLLSVVLTIVPFLLLICILILLKMDRGNQTDKNGVTPILDMNSSIKLSSTRIKAFGTAFQDYHDEYRQLPQAAFRMKDDIAFHSWQTGLLPFMNAQDVYNQIDLNLHWQDPANATAMATEIPTFFIPHTNPTSNENGFALSHYAANSLIIGRKEPFRFHNIEDGLSNSVLIGEVATGFKAWGDPGNIRDPSFGLKRGSNGFGSPLSEKNTQFLMADGSVRIVSNDIVMSELMPMFTPDSND